MAVAGGPVSSWAVLKGLELAYLNDRVAFSCEVLGSPMSATYQIMKMKDIPVTTKKHVSAGQPLKLNFKVTNTSAGAYYCKVTVQGKSSTSNILNLKVVIPVSGVSLRSVPNPPTVIEGSSLTLYCEVQKGSHLSYTWYHNRLEVTASSHMYHLSGNLLKVDKLTKWHAGSYYCSARNDIGVNTRTSISGEIHVTVQVNISAPKLSITLFRENASYYANLTCESAEGSVPVTFLLLLEGQEYDRQVANSLSVWFTRPMMVGMDMVSVHCRAETSHQQLTSNLLNLEMAPVGGPVYLHTEYLYNTNWQVVAIRLHCDINRGTFPSISWLHNNSLLHQSDCSKIPDDKCHVLFLTDVTPVNFGHYQCLVKDSFNISAPWVQSDIVLVESIDLPTITTEVIAVVFCCTLLIFMMGSLFCIFWMFNCPVLQSESGTIPERHSDAMAMPSLPLRAENMEDIMANEEMELCFELQ
ncbi:Fc receptor-like protein 5 isoform X2 [Sardina pilchardus]